MIPLRAAVGAAGARWAEAAVAGALTLALAGLALRWLAAGAALGWLWLAGAVALAFWLRAAVLGALLARRADMPGPGVVTLREGEIGYLGPLRGGFLEIDAIRRVEVFVITPGADPVWRLVGPPGQDLAIPSGAEGAAGLTKALAQLPGFSDLTAAAILRQRRLGRQVVWARPGGPRIGR